MKILVIDQDGVGLPYSMRCQEAGHNVRLWQPPLDGRPSKIGEGIVPKIGAWVGSMKWADMIVMTENSKFTNAIEPWFAKGYPIFGCNKKAARLELDREFGQDVLAAVGIETLPYEVFNSFDRAISFVKKEGRPFVSKPWGGDPDKSMSYVPKTAEDLVAQLECWKRLGKTGEFMLQEMVVGAEMAVGGWFGPGGWSPWFNENWEEKRLMNGGLGPNTGEMGTIMRYVRKSKLFEDVLRPVTDYLHDLNYVGYVDMNCIVDESGQPWPLEFTMRFGWPHFNLCMALHQGDPANWMADLLEGRDTLECSEDVCAGVVMAMGHYPWHEEEPEEVEGHPIRGIGRKTQDSLYLTSVRRDKAPCGVGGKVVNLETYVSSGSYVLVATGTGSTVEKARDSVYGTVDEVSWPPHKIYRTDIGCRLEEDLPKLQSHGYAEGMTYGTTDKD